MPRRRAAVAASALTIGLLCGAGLLSACAPLAGPTDEDRAAWQEWYDQTTTDAPGPAAGGVFSDATDDAGVTLELPGDMSYRSVELRCIGTDRGAFTLSYTTSAGTTTLSQDIVCHDGAALTPIAIPTAVQELTSFTATASSPDGEGYWVAILQQ